MNKIKISVVIPTYNGSSRIKKVIEAILSQNGINNNNFEIIVVDNNSTDNTADIVNEMASVNCNLRLITEVNQGRVYALLRGMQDSKNEIICNIDDDNIISENYLRNVIDLFGANHNLVACGGRGEAIFEGHHVPPDWFNHNSLSYAVGRPNISSGYLDAKVGWLYGAGFSYKKEALERVMRAGFQFALTGRKAGILLSGEDTELLLVLMLLGGDIYYDEELVFQHYIPNFRLNLQYLYKLNFGFGLASPVIGLYRANLLNNSLIGNLRKNYIIYISAQIVKLIGHYLNYQKTPSWSVRQQQIIGSLYSSIRHKKLWDVAKNNIRIIKSIKNKKC